MAEFVSARDRRLAKLRTGGGTFYYDGTATELENVPPLYAYKDHPMIARTDPDDPRVVEGESIDRYNRGEGTVALEPVTNRRVIKTPGRTVIHKLVSAYVLGEDRYVTNEKVEVGDEAADKLRRLHCFVEVLEDGKEAAGGDNRRAVTNARRAALDVAVDKKHGDGNVADGDAPKGKKAKAKRWGSTAP